MEYEDFINEIVNQVSDILNKEAEVILKKITKNNNVILDGISIRKECETISPTIYLNQYYSNYLCGDSIEDIVQQLIELYEQNRVQKKIDVDFFTQFENVKDRIVFKLIHFEKNKQLLEQIPHVKFMDLAIVFYYLVESDVFENATILIHSSHMDVWKKEILELFKIAKINSKNILQYQVNRIEDILKEELKDESIEEDLDSHIPMYVLSNQIQLYGATCMIYPDVLKNISDQLQSDLFVLPSSIHELIIIPQKSDCKADELKELVRNTNNTHVEKEEILSYNIYEYLREEEKIHILDV